MPRWESPVQRFRPEGRRIIGGPTPEFEKALSKAVSELREELSAKRYGGPFSTYPGYFTVGSTAPHSRNWEDAESQQFVKGLKWALLADGWNYVKAEVAQEAIHLELSALYDPVLVQRGEDDPFAPPIPPTETLDDAVRRIVQDGTWRYRSESVAEFIPPHQIRSIVVGRRFWDASDALEKRWPGVH